MKKVTRLGLVLMLMLSMVLGSSVIASAASKESSDGLEIKIVTDKDEYAKGEEIKVDIIVTNTNDYAVKNVSIEALLPEGLNVAEGSELNKTVDIEASSTEKLTVVAKSAVASDDEANAGNTEEDADANKDTDNKNDVENKDDNKADVEEDLDNVDVPKADGEKEEDIDNVDVPKADGGSKDDTDTKTDADASKSETADKDGANGTTTDGATNEKTDAPKAGDETNVVILTTIAAIALAAVVFLTKSKTVKKGCALLLAAVMIINIIPSGASASTTEIVEKTVSVDKEIKVADEAYVIKANVDYTVEVVTLENFTVEFNTNGGSDIPSVVIEEGSYAPVPNAPEKDGYTFDGWYLDNETFEQKFDFTVPVNENVTVYAKWEEIGVASGSISSVDVFNITELVVDKTTGIATATVCAPENCGLLVRFIEEDIYFSADYPANKEYIDGGDLFGSHVVEAGSDNAQISAVINGNIPENFVVEAILFDGEGNPLCDPFTNIENTTRYQAFINKTVNDFDEDDVVLNFDSAEDVNFGVLADDVKVVNADAVIYDEEANMYMLVLPSSEIVVGDKIYVTDGVNEYLFKVEDVVVEDDLCTVTPANSNDEEFGYNLNDFYKFLNVDMEYVGDVVTKDEEDIEVDSRLTYGGMRTYADIDIDENPSKELTVDLIDFEENGLDVKGSVTGEISCDIRIIYDIILFGEDYFRCDFTVTETLSGELTVDYENSGDKTHELAQKTIEKELTLGKVSIPFGVTGFSAFAKVEVVLEWDIKGEFEANGLITATQGFKHNTKDGDQFIQDKDSEWDIVCEGSATIKFGPSLSVGIEFLSGVVDISLVGFLGIEGKATVDGAAHRELTGNSVHCCNLCVDGSLDLVITVDVELNYNVCSAIKGTPIDENILTKKWDLFDFYVSLVNPTDSMFGGHMKAGKGSCPNSIYKVTVNTFNANRTSVTTNVDIYKNGELVTTVESGEATYLPDGMYMARATIEGKVFTEKFRISGKHKSIDIYGIEVSGPKSYISGAVVDAMTIDAIDGADVVVYEGSNVVDFATTDEEGKFKIELPQGYYKIVISAAGYRTVTTNVNLGYCDHRYVETTLMATYNPDSIMGGVYGCIKDAVTGRVVSGVKVEIVKGWNTDMDEAGEVVATTTTDYSGTYEQLKWTQHGVDFGLTAGNYTIMISKEGYIPTSFNITVVGGENLEFNSTITQVGSENVYRIVLTWGATPSDLDSHLNAVYEGSREHVFYSQKIGYGSDLDVDDTTSYGPETVTIPDITVFDGNIMYSVHDYSNRSSSSSMAMALSGAAVKVYKGAELLETFYVPSSMGGTVWNVFYIDENGNVVPVNNFEYQYDPDDVVGRIN